MYKNVTYCVNLLLHPLITTTRCKNFRGMFQNIYIIFGESGKNYSTLITADLTGSLDFYSSSDQYVPRNKYNYKVVGKT